MVGSHRELRLDLPGGRQLEVLADGPADGLPLLFHFGTPCGAVRYEPLVETASRQGLRTIVYSRPGYGTSTAKHGRSVADAVKDVEAILGELGADEFVTIGWSGGGPHALACAALLPDRCAGAVSLAGVAPYLVNGLDWMAGMDSANVREYSLAVQGEAVLTPFLERGVRKYVEIKGPEVGAALGSLVAEADRGALTGVFADFLAATFRHAVSNGVAGWRDDDLSFVDDWGFDLAKIEPPVAVWHGQQDRMVPFTHGRWLAEHIPKARVHLYRDEGHLSLVVLALDRIIEDLVAISR
jgi:pimeloyl-ACP methyl ester carboxylesterase